MKPKNIIPGLLIAITVFFFSRGCEKIAKPKDYKDFAEDYCTCFNESTASISEEAKQIFINSDPSNPEKMAMAYLTGEITEEDLEKIEKNNWERNTPRPPNPLFPYSSGAWAGLHEASPPRSALGFSRTFGFQKEGLYKGTHPGF